MEKTQLLKLKEANRLVKKAEVAVDLASGAGRRCRALKALR